MTVRIMGEFRLGLRVVHQVQIDKLLLLETVGLHVLENVGEESTDI